MAENNEQLAQMPSSSQECVITLELITLEDEFDPALLSAVGNATVVALQQEGYAVLPSAYTGQKGGGSFLVELVTTVQNISMAVWNNHVAIAEDIADLSGLVTIFGSMQAVAKWVQQAHEKLVGKQESTAHPIRIVVGVEEAPLVIEVADLKQADAVLQLVQKFRAKYPVAAAQVTKKSKAKVQVQMPARKRRPRR